MLSLAGCDPGHGEALGRIRYDNCAPCHGETGAGNREVGAPAIAGLPAWYVEAQLNKFRDGNRGAHPDDIEGLKMRPMARTLLSTEELQTVAARVEKMPPVRQSPTLSGDANRGKGLYATCAACHGASAEGQKDKNAPGLRQSGDWYLLAQLKKFKAGVRGTMPGDATGAQMRPMAMTLVDEQSMKDVIAYITTLSP